MNDEGFTVRKPTLKERVAALEAEVRDLERKVDNLEHPGRPWWLKIAGTFEDDPVYDKAMMLGRKYRESLRPKYCTRRASRGQRSLRKPVS